MKLYVCWGTWTAAPRPGGHPCGRADNALRDAGFEPDVQKVYGLGILGSALNPTRGEVRELTGQNMVPVLVTDDGETVQGSDRIVAWAREHAVTGANQPG